VASHVIQGTSPFTGYRRPFSQLTNLHIFIGKLNVLELLLMDLPQV
jgi:hypothetical protein